MPAMPEDPPPQARQPSLPPELQRLYGKGVTPESLLNFQQALTQAMDNADQQAIDAEVAAENAMRRKRRRRA